MVAVPWVDQLLLSHLAQQESTREPPHSIQGCEAA